jgi:hypothetical protein
MRRILVHEIAHQLVMERTGSRKTLGDGNRHMRVPPWLDEGMAELLAETAGGRPQRLEDALATLRSCPPRVTLGAVDDALVGLDSPARSEAFALATGAVVHLVQRRGLRAVFHDLEEIAACCGRERACAAVLSV